MLLPQYNVSRLVERVETAGYLERAVDPDDARRRIRTLTGAGRALLREMWPVYAGAIEAQVGSKLSDAEARRLAGLLARIVAPPA